MTSEFTDAEREACRCSVWSEEERQAYEGAVMRVCTDSQCFDAVLRLRRDKKDAADHAEHLAAHVAFRNKTLTPEAGRPTGVLPIGPGAAAGGEPAALPTPPAVRVGQVWRWEGANPYARHRFRVTGIVGAAALLVLVDGPDAGTPGSMQAVMTAHAPWTLVSDAPAEAPSFVQPVAPWVPPSALPQPSEADRLTRFFFPPERLPSWDPPEGAEPDAFAPGEWVTDITASVTMQVMERLRNGLYALIDESHGGVKTLRRAAESVLRPAKRPGDK